MIDYDSVVYVRGRSYSHCLIDGINKHAAWKYTYFHI
jgi:hypothetical protein